MENNQRAFLARIRAALGKEDQQQGAGEAGSFFLDHNSDNTVILQTLADRSREEQLILLRQLIAQAATLNLPVHTCTSLAGAAARIVALARDSEPEFGTRREIIIHDHPLLRALDLEPLLTAQGCTLHLSRDKDPAVRSHTLASYIGITAPAWGIADSATIVQLTRPGQPRSTSLVPSIHIAVLALSHLVASLAEAYALIGNEPDLDSLVLISGPSKTADIEAHMVHGAHGPRAMHWIVLTGEQIPTPSLNLGPQPVPTFKENPMPPVVSFIGWHNSGKTTLASQVVARLKERGYTVAVIKSTKERGLEIEQPGTDTALYRQVGADSVALLAPDQLIIRSQPPALSLLSLAHRFFADKDIVIAEGFKSAPQVAKIEVKRDHNAPWLRDQVEGVMAVATDLLPADGLVFGLDQSRELADFIEARFLHCPKPAAQVTLTVNGETLVLPQPVPDQLVAAVQAALAPLQPTFGPGTIELSIRYHQPPEVSN